MKPVVVWHRYDLRTSDHQGLAAAASTGAPIVPVFIYSPETEVPWGLGAASRWWLHHSLKSLQESYKKLGLKLHIRRAENSALAIMKVLSELGADELFLDRRFEPAILNNDRELAKLATKAGVTIHAFNHHLILPIQDIRNGQGKVYQVFTPFYKSQNLNLERAVKTEFEKIPSSLKGSSKKIESLSVDALKLLPRLKWADHWLELWSPGEEGAKKNLKIFLESRLSNYSSGRDRPDFSATSTLSPHLRFGEISPLRILKEVSKIPSRGLITSEKEKFISELVWREFAHYLMLHFPETPLKPLRPEYAAFPWDKVEKKNWKNFIDGKTGFPIVDAGMRELWHTGWMHNRVRMIVASFLVKDLRYPWVEGAKWFWDTLVDADLASNTFGWQWSAGCGADAAPYFRIFNPTLQGERFDPEGVYVKKWIPELRSLSAKNIHSPQLSGVNSGYPAPMVVHSEARDLALAAFSRLRKTIPAKK